MINCVMFQDEEGMSDDSDAEPQEKSSVKKSAAKKPQEQPAKGKKIAAAASESDEGDSDEEDEEGEDLSFGAKPSAALAKVKGFNVANAGHTPRFTDPKAKPLAKGQPLSAKDAKKDLKKPLDDLEDDSESDDEDDDEAPTDAKRKSVTFDDKKAKAIAPAAKGNAKGGEEEEDSDDFEDEEFDSDELESDDEAVVENPQKGSAKPQKGSAKPGKVVPAPEASDDDDDLEDELDSEDLESEEEPEPSSAKKTSAKKDAIPASKSSPKKQPAAVGESDEDEDDFDSEDLESEEEPEPATSSKKGAAKVVSAPALTAKASKVLGKASKGATKEAESDDEEDSDLDDEDFESEEVSDEEGTLAQGLQKGKGKPMSAAAKPGESESDDEDEEDEDDDEEPSPMPPAKKQKTADMSSALKDFAKTVNEPASQAVTTASKKNKADKTGAKAKSDVTVAKPAGQVHPAATTVGKQATVEMADQQLAAAVSERADARNKRCLFVKNLPRKLSDRDIMKACSPDILGVRRHSHNAQYAVFIFANEKIAEKNQKMLHKKKVGDRQLFVDFIGDKSQHSKPSSDSKWKEGTMYNSSALFISDVPAGTGFQDLKEYFPSCTAIEMPRESGSRLFTATVFFPKPAVAKASFAKYKNLCVKGVPVMCVYALIKEHRKDVGKKRKANRCEISLFFCV